MVQLREQAFVDSPFEGHCERKRVIIEVAYLLSASHSRTRKMNLKLTYAMCSRRTASDLSTYNLCVHTVVFTDCTVIYLLRIISSWTYVHGAELWRNHLYVRQLVFYKRRVLLCPMAGISIKVNETTCCHCIGLNLFLRILLYSRFKLILRSRRIFDKEGLSKEQLFIKN